MAAKELPAAPVGNAKARKDKNSNFQRQLTAICEAVEPIDLSDSQMDSYASGFYNLNRFKQYYSPL